MGTPSPPAGWGSSSPQRLSWSGQCQNHPEREGIGICLSCHRVFCSECITKIDGVNYCQDCLAQIQPTKKTTPQGEDPPAKAALPQKEQPAPRAGSFHRFIAYSMVLLGLGLFLLTLFLFGLYPTMLALLGEKL
jgi:hypothetical protein